MVRVVLDTDMAAVGLKNKMKISRTRLKQIIKEELSNVAEAEESFKERPGDALHLRMSDRLRPRSEEERGMSREELEARRNEEFRQKILQAVDDLINQRLSKYGDD